MSYIKRNTDSIVGTAKICEDNSVASKCETNHEYRASKYLEKGGRSLYEVTVLEF